MVILFDFLNSRLIYYNRILELQEQKRLMNLILMSVISGICNIKLLLKHDGETIRKDKIEEIGEEINREISKLNELYNKKLKQYEDENNKLKVENTSLKNKLSQLSNSKSDNKIEINVDNKNDDNKNDVIVDKLNELIKLMKPKRKYKKQRISKTLRTQVWNKWIGVKIGMIKCPNCKVYDISQSNFECGHYIPESQGGLTDITNLLPICSDCNKSNGTKTMNLKLWEEIKINSNI